MSTRKFMRLSIVAIICLLGTLPMIGVVSAQSTSTGFILLASSGQWYALVGIAPSGVSGLSASSVVYVVGVWSGPPSYTSPSPDYSFKGTIYVTRYSLNGWATIYGTSYSATSNPPPSGLPISMQGILVWSTSYPNPSTMVSTNSQSNAQHNVPPKLVP
jgi:hypothetical protein